MIGFHPDYIDSLLDIEADLPEMEEGDREPFQQKTYVLHDEQAELVEEAIAKANKHPACEHPANDNTNANAIWFICKQWLEARQ